MKTNRSIRFWLFLLACAALTPAANAFYNPQPGRWLNRDPIGEPGFGVASDLKRNANKHILDYAFVVNSPTAYWDYLGLDNPGCDLIGVPPFNQACFLKCCAQHDTCFYDRGCEAIWAWPLTVLLGPCTPCGRCNIQVAGCWADCLVGGDGPGNPPYFCAKFNNYYYNWDDIPDVCWKNGKPKPKPDGYP